MAVAYLSAEIGLWSELHTYSGGLGVLAGDHIKSAADAGLDLVGVTLLYRQGYGRQHLDSDGIQTESYAEIDPSEHLLDTGIELALPLDGTTLISKIWVAEVRGVRHGRRTVGLGKEAIVGRTGSDSKTIPVLFLDTRHPQNSSEHSSLGDRLYGGDDANRIRQEYLLGVGGIRALQLLGHTIEKLHLNEGHCTFAMLEMLRQGWNRNELAGRTLFTTHTPVPAGHDRFEWSAVEEVLGDMLPTDARNLVRQAGDSEGGERCSMSHLAVALSGSVNAVSNLNAFVASSMFPHTHIAPITNGVHHMTWTSSPMANVYDEHMPGWRSDPALLAHAGRIPDTDLNSARTIARAVLRDLVSNTTGVELHPDRLTIGFARRFATYKRADLVFHHLERLRSFGAGNIQFVFAGKAHPRDEGGKALIRSIFGNAKQIAEEIPVAFLEDYSMATGLAMTSGVDIWLNNPVRPMEASGTSGMKAAMNGVPNCSILDGWWPEACEHGVNGWAIGGKEDDRDDERDATAVLDVIEEHVLPTWKEGGQRWASISRAAIATSARFTGARMISDYQRFYTS
jgi:starch phosphorylase